MRVPIRRSEVWAQAQKTNDPFMTPVMIERLKKELERLEKIERGPAAEEVARMAQMGDLSENAGYQYAKQHLRKINSRILAIDEKLRFAVPIDQSVQDGKVRIGSTVTIENQGKTQTFEILGSNESDPFKGRISYGSPLGMILMGKTVGETASLKTATATISYTVMNVQ